MKLTIKEAEMVTKALWNEACKRISMAEKKEYAHIIQKIKNEYGLTEYDVLRDKSGKLLYASHCDIRGHLAMKDKFEADGIEVVDTCEWYADENWMNQ